MIKVSRVIFYCLFAILALTWGLSFFGTKVALQGLDPIEVLTVRWSISFMLFLLFVGTGRIKLNYKGKPMKLLLWTVAMQPCAFAIVEAIGIDMTTASESSIFIAMVPIMVAFLSGTVLKQKMSRLLIFAIGIAFTGIAISVLGSPSFSTGGKLIGYLMLILAVICGAIYSIFSSRISTYFNTWEITFAMAMSASLFFNLISIIEGNGLRPYRVFFQGGETMWGLIYLGVGCSFVAYVIFNYTLSKMSATIATAIQTNAINVVGVLSGIVLCQDPWGWYTIVGIGLTMLGVSLASSQIKDSPEKGDSTKKVEIQGNI